MPPVTNACTLYVVADVVFGESKNIAGIDPQNEELCSQLLNVELTDPAVPTLSAVEFLTRFKYPPLVALEDTKTCDNTKILLVADDGVIDTESPVISTGVRLVVVNASSFVVLTTCNTEPAGKPAVVALLNNTPLLSGSVSVRLLLLLGAAIVNVPVPLALPWITALLMFSPRT